MAGVLLTGLVIGLTGQTAPASAAEADPGAGEWALDRPCTNAIVLGARGSGQSLDDHFGLGAEVYGVYEGLAKALTPKGLTTSFLPVRYPAVPMEYWLGGDPNILDSVDQARTETRVWVAAIHTKCPTTRIVLAGYSRVLGRSRGGPGSYAVPTRRQLPPLCYLRTQPSTQVAVVGCSDFQNQGVAASPAGLLPLTT